MERRAGGVDDVRRHHTAPGSRDTTEEHTTMISTYEFLATWLRARFGDTDRGASMVEYALLVALIAVVCIVAIRGLGNSSKSSFESTGTAIGNA